MNIHEIKINAEGFTRLHSVNGFRIRCADCRGMKIHTNLYEALFFRLCLATWLWVFRFAVGARHFSFLKCVEIGPGTRQA
jgi:hypothetical protein